MPRIHTFEDAISHARRHGRRPSVLLGNGFSIDYDASVFNYSSLAEEARLDNLSVSKEELFGSLSSSNFEVVIDKLRAASSLLLLYDGDSVVAEKMASDADIVRNGLADVLANRHPENAQVLDHGELLHVRKFLSNFHSIFTLNYDLLLYWAVNREGTGPSVSKRDGFEWPSRTDTSGLIWKSNPTQGTQLVHFLHGALHLFVRDRRLTKLSFSESGRLISELQSRLETGVYPLVVTEGTRAEKEAKIEQSAYLRTALRRFASTTGTLFIHGASMSANDEHIFESIAAESSGLTGLYIGLHGAASTAGNRQLIESVREIKRARNEGGGRKLRARFYDAASAQVWRDR